MSGPELLSMAELEELVAAAPGLFLRWSRGPEADEEGLSRDHESGLVLPGLSVNPLTPEPWWTRPLGDWLARQLCQYAHLRQAPDERRAWVLSGPVVGRGPDNEPLVAPPTFVAWVHDRLVDEAHQRYHEVFEVGRDSRHVG